MRRLRLRTKRKITSATTSTDTIDPPPPLKRKTGTPNEPPQSESSQPESPQSEPSQSEPLQSDPPQSESPPKLPASARPAAANAARQATQIRIYSGRRHFFIGSAPLFPFGFIIPSGGGFVNSPQARFSYSSSYPSAPSAA